MNFIVAFNPSFGVWQIDTKSPIWQVVRWTVWRSPIMRLYGYKTYIIVMYIMVAAVLLAVIGLVWLTLAMRKLEQSKALRMAATVLHIVFDVMFMCCYVSFFGKQDLLGPLGPHGLELEAEGAAGQASRGLRHHFIRRSGSCIRNDGTSGGRRGRPMKGVPKHITHVQGGWVMANVNKRIRFLQGQSFHAPSQCHTRRR